jgi:hypothetical protein
MVEMLETQEQFPVPVKKVRLSGGTLFDWIPAFAGMTTVH